MNWLDEAEVTTAEQKAQAEREALQTRMTRAIQNYLDEKAQERNYDSMLSLATYATDENPKFAAEGQAGVKWRGQVWAKGYEILAAVEAGTRPVPTEQELISELPTLRWSV